MKAQDAADVARADSLLGQVTDLRDRAIGILKKAEDAENFTAALGAIREARGCVELLGKLAGELRDAPTINLVLMPQWRTLQLAILTALEDHTDARRAVVTALSRIESHHVAGHA